MVLLKFGKIILKWGRIAIRFFDPWDLIPNFVSKCADPFSVYANVWANQESAKYLAKARPMIDFLQVCIVQFLALILSVTQSTTGWGLVIILLSNISVRAAQKLMIIVTYLRQFIETNVSSSLFFRCNNACWTISSGKDMYHQTLSVVEYHPQAWSELSPIKEAVGVLEMMTAIGTSNQIPKSFFKGCCVQSSSACMVSLTK